MSFLNNFEVVPSYDSNSRLAGQIARQLDGFLEVKNYNGPPPKIVVFRPTGRPADEFKEAVNPILENSSSVYLVVAFSGQYKDISELVPYGLKDRVVRTVHIFIQAGNLVGQDSPHYNSNTQQLKVLATQLSKDYGVTSEQAALPTTSDVFSSSVDFCLSQDDANLLGRAVALLVDFPKGVCLKELLAMMSLDDKETTAMKSVLRLTTSMFEFEGKGEDDDIFKLKDSFFNYLAKVKSGKGYREAASRISQTGATGKEDPKIPKQIITLNDVAQFVESVKQSPQLLDPELTSLIQSTINIQGHLVNRLGHIVGAHREKCNAPVLNPVCAQITPEVFLNFVESRSVKLDIELTESLEREFKITYKDLIRGLQDVCLKLREEMKMKWNQE